MRTKTMQLGKHSLLSLAGNLEIEIRKISSKRKPKLFCKHESILLTPRILAEHKCLEKRRYVNKEGKEIVIICPHVTTLKAEPYYKEVSEKEPIFYHGEKQVVAITHEFKHKPTKPEFKDKEDLWSKQARNLVRLKLAGKVLTGSG